MAKFLNTSATNYFLEELIKDAKELLILSIPYLDFSEYLLWPDGFAPGSD